LCPRRLDKGEILGCLDLKEAAHQGKQDIAMSDASATGSSVKDIVDSVEDFDFARVLVKEGDETEEFTCWHLAEFFSAHCYFPFQLT
jgi:hypothetical protein